MLGTFVALAGCSSRQQAQQQSQPPSSQTSQSPSGSPPQPGEVDKAVKRVFKSAAMIDESRSPSFVVGDFNGDKSEDVAVIIKTAPGKTSEMNQQFPPWILKDPFLKTAPGMTLPRVSEGETCSP
jgi:hypothetical protein